MGLRESRQPAAALCRGGVTPAAKGVVRPGLGGPLGGGGRAGILDLGEERAVARGTVVAVGGSAMGATASSLASCRGQGCSSSGSSARRRGETRIGLGEDEDGLSSYKATARRMSTATACSGVASRGAWQTCGVLGGGFGRITGAQRQVWTGAQRVAGQRTGRRPQRSPACNAVTARKGEMVVMTVS